MCRGRSKSFIGLYPKHPNILNFKHLRIQLKVAISCHGHSKNGTLLVNCWLLYKTTLFSLLTLPIRFHSQFQYFRWVQLFSSYELKHTNFLPQYTNQSQIGDSPHLVGECGMFMLLMDMLTPPQCPKFLLH